eukprot:COSAG04_NODE_11210_length_723_cov_1.080128_2_plen_88_part_01
MRSGSAATRTSTAGCEIPRTAATTAALLHAMPLLCSLIVLWLWHIRGALSHVFSSAVLLWLCGCCDACLQPAVYQQPFSPSRHLPLLL